MVKKLKIDLNNKIIIVTGGYGFLGKGICESILAHDATVIIFGKDKKKFVSNFQSIKNLHFISCDISITDEIRKSLNLVVKNFSKIDCIINNAFYLRSNDPEKISDLDFDFSLKGTLSSVFKCIREIIPIYKKQNFGKIINVSSMYGFISPTFEIYKNFEHIISSPAYGSAKAGIIQLTKYYASYLGEYNVNVNCVSPGAFPSLEVQKNIEFIERLKNKTVLNRIGNPKDLGGVFSFLSSDLSNYITGQNIVVDGGWSIR